MRINKVTEYNITITREELDVFLIGLVLMDTGSYQNGTPTGTIQQKNLANALASEIRNVTITPE